MENKVLQVSRFLLKPGHNLLDQSTPEGKALLDAIQSVLRQPGAHRTYYGCEVEDATHFWFMVDWDSVEQHDTYLATEEHGRVMGSLVPFCNLSQSFSKHFTPQPYPVGNILDTVHTPVTEILMATFPSDIDQASKQDVVQRTTTFLDKALEDCSTVLGHSFGWSVENDVPSMFEDVQGTMLVAFIGWPSIEEQDKLRAIPAFTDNVGILKTLPGLTSLGLLHVKATSKVLSDFQ